MKREKSRQIVGDTGSPVRISLEVTRFPLLPSRIFATFENLISRYIRNSNRSFPKIYRTCIFRKACFAGKQVAEKMKAIEIHLQRCEEYKRNSNSLHFDLTIKRIKIDRNISSRIS